MAFTPDNLNLIRWLPLAVVLGIVLGFVAILMIKPVRQALPGGRPVQEAGVVSPLEGKTLYVFPDNLARQAMAKETDPAAIALIKKIADRPVAQWYGQWVPDVRAAVAADVASAADSQLPVLVLYNVPHRDCGQHSAGGAGDVTAYRAWIDQVAQGLGNKPAMVIVEPDALPQVDCLNAANAQDRFDLLKYAVTKLTANKRAAVYLDAGNARWGSVDTMAARLRQAGIDQAAGFSVNVSNYYSNEESRQYAKSVAAALGGKHFVIDTSRNGNGPLSEGAWCNPAGRALGTPPALVRAKDGLDAYLWVKQPGASDGACNGGPAAGQWWRQNALELAGNAH